MEFGRSSDKTSREEHDFRNIEGNGTQATCKQTSDGNPIFVIGDPMNKVHMGKNKSLVSSASTKMIWNVPMVCEGTRYCIIEKVNFVIKIPCGIRILAYNKVFNDFHILHGWCMICNIYLMKSPIWVSSGAACMRSWQDI